MIVNYDRNRETEQIEKVKDRRFVMSMQKRRLIRQMKQIVWNLLMYISTITTFALLVLLIGYVVTQGVGKLDFVFLTTAPSYLSGNIGILPDILNTVYLLIVTMIVLLPVGVGAAIYLSEYAKNYRIVRIIDYAAEILSGIPSIIYGLVGMLFFCQFLGMGTSILAGGLTLVVMNLPTILRTTRESLLTVPKGLREGAYGLGVSKWKVIKLIVLPGCMDGIITGCILSAGKILGESAALLFTAGFAHTLHGFLSGVNSSGATLTVALYIYAKEQGEFEVAFSIAVILLLLAILVNLSAKAVKRAYRHRK